MISGNESHPQSSTFVRVSRATGGNGSHAGKGVYSSSRNGSSERCASVDACCERFASTDSPGHCAHHHAPTDEFFRRRSVMGLTLCFTGTWIHCAAAVSGNTQDGLLITISIITVTFIVSHLPLPRQQILWKNNCCCAFFKSD